MLYDMLKAVMIFRKNIGIQSLCGDVVVAQSW